MTTKARKKAAAIKPAPSKFKLDLKPIFPIRKPHRKPPSKQQQCFYSAAELDLKL